MTLAFRYRVFEGNPDDVVFVRSTRGRVPGGLTQIELVPHSVPAKCNDLARRMLTGNEQEPFRHLMHKAFRAGWRFTQGERHLDEVEYYFHVVTVRRTDTGEIRLDATVVLTIESAARLEATTRESKPYRDMPVDVTVETYALVFGDSGTQQKQLSLLRKLRVSGADKDAICTLLESGFEAGMAACRNLAAPVPAAEPALSHDH